jgi:hypothetical protein
VKSCVTASASAASASHAFRWSVSLKKSRNQGPGYALGETTSSRARMPSDSATSSPASRGMKRCQAGRRSGEAAVEVTVRLKPGSPAISRNGPPSSVQFSDLRLEAGATHSPYYVRRRRQARARRIKRLSFAAFLLVVAGVIVGLIVYAGSPGTLAKGVEIDGVDVGPRWRSGRRSSSWPAGTPSG